MSDGFRLRVCSDAAASECVFIGGKKDGQRISIPADRTSVAFMVWSESRQWEEIYHMQRIVGSHTSFRVFALSIMNGDDIIAELLRVYVRNKS